MDELLRAIPDAAKSPLALAAYVIAAIVALAGGLQLKERRDILKLVEKTSKDMSPAGLEKIIVATTNTPLPRNVTGKQWLEEKRIRGRLIIALALIITLLTVAIATIDTMAKMGAAADTLSGGTRAAGAAGPATTAAVAEGTPTTKTTIQGSGTTETVVEGTTVGSGTTETVVEGTTVGSATTETVIGGKTTTGRATEAVRPLVRCTKLPSADKVHTINCSAKKGVRYAISARVTLDVRSAGKSRILLWQCQGQCREHPIDYQDIEFSATDLGRKMIVLGSTDVPIEWDKPDINVESSAPGIAAIAGVKLEIRPR